MSEVIDGMCIIDAISGIDCATPQIGQFTDNFDKVKFLLGKDFNDYTMIIVTDINGHVEIINTDGENLIKESADGETNLVWNIGANITSESGVVIYQIVAYKENGENIEKVWYSKEGRLIVTESISTNEYSASLIGSYPNLLTRLLIDIDNMQKELVAKCNSKVDAEEGMGLSQNSFSNYEKEKLSAIEEGAEVNVASDWQEDDENSDSYIKNKPNLASVATSGSYTDLKDKPIVDNAYNSKSQNAQSGTAVAEAIAQLVNSSPDALNTLYELASALDNDPNFATTVAKEIGTKVDKIEGKVLSSNDYTDAEKEKLASVQQGAEKNVKSDWAEEDANSDKFIKNKPQLSEVALSGSYDDLTDTPQIPSVEGLASEEYVDKKLEEKADQTTVNEALADVESLGENKADILKLETEKAKAIKVDDASNKKIESLVLYGEGTGTQNPKVRVFGKNLCNHYYDDSKSDAYRSGLAKANNDDGSFNLSGTLRQNFSYCSEVPIFIPKGTKVTAWGSWETPYDNVFVGVTIRGATNNLLLQMNSKLSGQSMTVTLTEDAKSVGYMFRLPNNIAGDTMEIKNIKLQLEIGSVLTDFESYKEIQSAEIPYTLSDGDTLTMADGAVKTNISGTKTDITNTECGKSLLALHTNYPSTTVLCECETELTYKADTTMAFNKLKQAILSLGGNI